MGNNTGFKRNSTASPTLENSIVSWRRYDPVRIVGRDVEAENNLLHVAFMAVDSRPVAIDHVRLVAGPAHEGNLRERGFPDGESFVRQFLEFDFIAADASFAPVLGEGCADLGDEPAHQVRGSLPDCGCLFEAVFGREALLLLTRSLLLKALVNPAARHEDIIRPAVQGKAELRIRHEPLDL